MEGVFFCACGDRAIKKVLAQAGSNGVFCDSPDCLVAKNQQFTERTRQTRIADNGSFQDLHPELAKEWLRCVSHPTVTPDAITEHSTVKVEWQCRVNDKHCWTRTVDGRVTNQGCPFCKANISRMQLRFSAELSYWFDLDIQDSLKVLIGGKKIEIDIPLLLEDGSKVAIELDGYIYHEGKIDQDRKKDRALESAGWLVIRIRDNRLAAIETPDRVFPVSSNAFYEKEWRQTVLSIIDFIGYESLEPYDEYKAQDLYQKKLKSCGLGGQ